MSAVPISSLWQNGVARDSDPQKGHQEMLTPLVLGEYNMIYGCHSGRSLCDLSAVTGHVPPGTNALVLRKCAVAFLYLWNLALVWRLSHEEGIAHEVSGT